jgi:DNA mismatch repair protein MutL
VAIFLLDEQTINQIAAGEVVESPASVLKELVENAIDAQADHLEIEAVGGGLEKLCVMDNGHGMSLEDLEKCILRHATSKLRSLEDLVNIQTMGFRGEALAAIAAVSHLKIQTCSAQSSQKGAWQLEVRAGEILSLEPCARAVGTSIEVRDLFFNVPARKVFQKGPSASASELTRVIGALALSYPQVQWVYRSSKTPIHWPSASYEPAALLERCRLVLGDAFAAKASFIQAERQGWKLRGWLAHAQEHKPSRQGQYWIVNHRLVQLPQMGYWIQEGYGTRLPAARFPSFVLHLDLPGSWVDVNVHPQKKEVRLKDPGWLGSWLAHQVNLALSGLSPALETSPGPEPSHDPFEISSKDSREDPVQTRAFKPSVSASLMQEKEPAFELASLPCSDSMALKRAVSSPLAFDFDLRPLATWKQFSLWPVDQLRERLKGWDKEVQEGTQPWVLAWMSSSRALARLRFEQAMRSQQEVLSHALLIPLRLQWRIDEMDLLLRHELLLKNLGMDWVALDRQSLALHTLPVGLEESQAQAFLEACLLLLEKPRGLHQETAALLLARFIENERLNAPIGSGVAPSELILGLSNCHQPFYSPSGKPIFKPLALGDLELKGRRGESA